MDDTGGGWDYQRAIVAALNAEIGARGWTRKYLGELAGINEQQMLRLFNCHRQLNVAQLGAMVDALGVTIEHIAAEADRWSRELPATRSDRPAPRPTDPRELLLWLIANPSQDDVLNGRLSEVESRTGLSGNALGKLRDQIRHTRRAELRRALAALAPSTKRADQTL